MTFHLPFASSAGATPSPQAREKDPLNNVKRGIWIYFWLLLLEGALRKWILPNWSAPLLIIRDPVVIYIYAMALYRGVFPQNAFIGWIIALSALSIFFSEIVGKGNLLVTLYGFRTNFLHLPLIFVIGAVFTKEDIDKMGKWILLSTIPMSFLVLAQFRAEPGSWLNYGAGGGGGGQLESSFGKIRPPGTFSFTAGLVPYLAIAAVFALYAQMNSDGKRKDLAIAGLVTTAIMIGISGSRAALAWVALLVVALIVVCCRKPKFFGGGIRTIAFVVLAFSTLSFWSEFRQGVEVHQSRIEGSGGVKSGMIDRVISGIVEPLKGIVDAPFFGVGLGMGTNAASGFLYGKVDFLLGEGDWERTIGESGPILGLCYITLRLAILAHLALRAFRSLDAGHPLPLLLLSAAAPLLFNGQLGVPSLLGLAVFGGGLSLAATNISTLVATAEPALSPAEALLAGVPSVRGRSIYAEELHGEIEDPLTARFGP